MVIIWHIIIVLLQRVAFSQQKPGDVNELSVGVWEEEWCQCMSAVWPKCVRMGTSPTGQLFYSSYLQLLRNDSGDPLLSKIFLQ